MPPQAAVQLPRYDHVVIVVEENHAASQIIGNRSAPFINALAAGGALMTQSYAVAHPSQPNYLVLFAGDTFGVASDACPLALAHDQEPFRGRRVAGFEHQPVAGDDAVAGIPDIAVSRVQCKGPVQILESGLVVRLTAAAFGTWRPSARRGLRNLDYGLAITTDEA